MKSSKWATLVSISPDLVSLGGVLVKEGEPYKTRVLVLAIAGKWAMVRRPYAMPFVVNAKNLRPDEQS